MVHKNIHVLGRVQGVGYRYAAKEQAKYFRIKGYVKNMHDGSVYIEAEGKSENINEFIYWCRQGPPFANVTSIEVSDGEVKNYSFFDVRF